jgi:hypothetical protein
MSTNAGKQVAGFILSPDWVYDPQLALPYLKEMADHGYVVAVCFVRSMRWTVCDAPVHDCIKQLAVIAHQLSMQFVLDTDHAFWDAPFVESHPDAVMLVYGSAETTAHDGIFTVSVANPPTWEGTCVLDDLVAIYCPDGAGYQHIPATEIEWTWQNCAKPVQGVQVRGRLSDTYNGPLVAYIAFRMWGQADLAHPASLEAQRQLIAQYRDVALDGFGWDEPAKGMGHPGYFKAGRGFLELFRRENGYELLPNLIYLDHLSDTAQAVRIRSDYYRTLNTMNLQAQEEHNRYAVEGFGKELFFGTHQTWSGLPMDLAAGVIDYFRLGRVLTAAWTDGSWDVELRYQAFHYLLADGVRLELGLRDAYYNDWTAEVPAVENMRFANRFKKLFHVNWFNIFFSHFTEHIVNFRFEPLRTRAIEEIRDLDAFDALLDEGMAAQSDIAWLFLWEGIAALPKWFSRVYYTYCGNTALHLADRGLFATLVGLQSIADAVIDAQGFTIHGRRYRVLLVPYAYALPEATYCKILSMAEAGIPVVFVGPPPSFTDAGVDLRETFVNLLGTAPFTLAQYEAAYHAHHAPVPLNQWEPEWFDFAYPMTVTDGQATYDAEGDLLYVRSPRLPLYYLSQLDPREDLVNLLAALTKPVAETFAEGTYLRIFAGPQHPMRQVVLAVAHGHIAEEALVPDRYARARPPRKPHAVKAHIQVQGGTLIIHGGSWCAVRLEDGQITGVVGDAAQITWNGQPVRVEGAQ